MHLSNCLPLKYSSCVTKERNTGSICGYTRKESSQQPLLRLLPPRILPIFQHPSLPQVFNTLVHFHLLQVCLSSDPKRRIYVQKFSLSKERVKKPQGYASSARDGTPSAEQWTLGTFSSQPPLLLLGLQPNSLSLFPGWGGYLKQLPSQGQGTSSHLFSLSLCLWLCFLG